MFDIYYNGNEIVVTPIGHEFDINGAGELILSIREGRQLGWALHATAPPERDEEFDDE